MTFRFPHTRDYESLRSCYIAFQSGHPDIFAKWVRIEAKGRDVTIDELEAVSTVVRAFLETHWPQDSHMAFIKAWMDMRWMLIVEHWPERLTDGGNPH